MCLFGTMAVADVDIVLTDSQGNPLVDTSIVVISASGEGLAKEATVPGGIQTVAANPGDKLIIDVGGNIFAEIVPASGDLEIQVLGAPANDECDAAGMLGFGLNPGTTVGATEDANVFGFECGDDAGITAPGVWYTVQGTGTVLTISTCENTSGGSADYDSKLSVYCGGCDQPTCVAGNDDEPSCNFHSEVDFCSQANVDYLVYLQLPEPAVQLLDRKSGRLPCAGWRVPGRLHHVRRRCGRSAGVRLGSWHRDS